MSELKGNGAATSTLAQTSNLERFRLLVEQVTEYAMFLLDSEGYIATWNPGAERIKGYTESEIVGQHFSKFYRPEDVWKVEYELEVARREGRVEDEGWRVRKDGTLFWANVVITCLHDTHGNILGYAKVTRDLTDRKREEETLRQSEERFRLLVENVRDYAIFILDERGYITTWNTGAQRIKGYLTDEIIGKHFSCFYPQAEVRSGKCEMELEVAAREGRFEDEGWRLRKDGSAFWANVVITALRDATGKLFGYAKVTRDLTERRAAEQERLRLGVLAQERVNTLTTLSENLARASTMDEVARAVIETGMTFAHADTCMLYLLDSQTKRLELFAERGCHPGLIDRIRTITAESGNPTYAIGAGTAQPAWIESHSDYLAYFPALASLALPGRRAQAFACVPLVAERRILGMIGLGFLHERAFSDDERAFITTFARQSAQALARAHRLETERAAAILAERLRASLSTTLRSIGDAVIATDATGAITLMNSVAESLTGWREDEARGRSIAEVFRIIDEQTRQLAPNPFAKLLAASGVADPSNHTLLIARDGREIPIENSGAPIRADDGTAEGVVLVFRDVTERERSDVRRRFLAEASAVLAQSLDYEATVTRVAQLAVPRLADWCAVHIVKDGASTRLAIAHVDPAKVQLAGELERTYPPNLRATTGVQQVLRTGQAELYREVTDDMLVESCIDATHLEMARELNLRSAMIVPLVAHGKTLGALSFVYSESERRYDDKDLQVAEDLARRCAQAIENARLYTSEQHARRTADIASRAKDEFLAIVSHELRTPLNAIVGWAKLLSTADFDERRRQRAVETIERNADAMAQLIEDLLDMSRVISGKLRLEVQHVDVLSVVEAAIDSIRPAAAAKHIELVPVLDNSASTVMGDPTRLQQIVWNLMSNAVKFTPKGGRVAIVFERVESSLELTVSDSGKGIDPGFLPYVFDAFRQEDASASRTRGGLGLGLAISRQLVELHGGRIAAQSAGEGRGATFTVLLPIAVTAPAVDTSSSAMLARKSHDAIERPEQLRGLRVLVVDDEEDARTLVATVLEDCGCYVTSAASVQQALERLTHDRPDVMLSDIGMAEEDGYSLIRKVRKLPRNKGGDIPAAALTAYARAEDRRKMLNAGYSIHLAKPVEPAELIAVVWTLSRFIYRDNTPEA